MIIEAQEIKEKLRQYLHEQLGLDVSTEKTLITRAKTAAARFLGYDIKVRSDDDRIDDRGHRGVTEKIELRGPRDVMNAKVAKRLAKGKPIHRAGLRNDRYV